MDAKDTFTKGFLAGLAGGISTTLVGLPLYMLKISTLRFADFSAILIYGHKPNSILEYLFALLIHWGFAAAGGILFAFMINAISTRSLLLKGWFFGVGLWFSAYVVATLFKVPGLTVVSLINAFTTLLISSVYGIVLAWVYSYIEQKTGKVGV